MRGKQLIIYIYTATVYQIVENIGGKNISQFNFLEEEGLENGK